MREVLKAVAAALGERPAPGPRHGGFDTVNTNVLGIGGRTFALVEAGSYPVELTDDLDQQTYNPFDDTLAGSFTAHPHQDRVTGEWHAIAYEATDPETVRYVRLSPEGQVTRELPIAVKHGPSIHDCAFTDRYVIVMDLPVTFSMKALIGGHSFPYRWNGDHRVRDGDGTRSATRGGKRGRVPARERALGGGSALAARRLGPSSRCSAAGSVAHARRPTASNALHHCAHRFNRVA